MASNVFMIIKQGKKGTVVTGESADDLFKGKSAFEIADFALTIAPPEDDTSTTTTASTPAKSSSSGAKGGKSGDAGSGATQLGDFTIHKAIDSASIGLFKACLQKDEFAEVWVLFFQTGEKDKKPYLVLKFAAVKVTGFEWSEIPGDGHHELKDEKVTFHAGKMKVEYGKQDRTGLNRQTPLQVASWDCDQHKIWNESPEEMALNWSSK